MWVTRKGAIRAGAGELGIIPGSMGTRSYIVRGKGSAESFHSCAHGAGPPHEPQRRAEEVYRSRTWTSRPRASCAARTSGVIDEIPGAYKPIDEVMENQSRPGRGGAHAEAGAVRERMSMKRRQILAAALLVPLESLAQTCGVITPRQTEGPFFTPKSPQRISLLEGGEKTRLVLVGTVLTPDCKPIPNALLDFWHSDEQGAYDNRGFRYRGHQHADAQGRYRLETIVPAQYPGRTRHIHVKVQPPGGRILTTQVYFPGDPGNRRDGLYLPELELKSAKAGEGTFDFVVTA